ncbi:hypothetical protein Mgra_00004483 [Meloidogyne graminicola]|uniref:Uncharacterized protein n=1 Tax=Meloidogyne graminicola TaxID=189291 RepID=A0A8S9ZS41_9BILA|nr:hypothetical protein Mgra_00004483 [Meloidogyne graminicola]
MFIIKLIYYLNIILIFNYFFFLIIGIPFNRFPISAIGIERLGNYDLNNYIKLINKLKQKINLLKENNLIIEIKKLLIKNGFKDEVEFENTRPADPVPAPFDCPGGNFNPGYKHSCALSPNFFLPSNSPFQFAQYFVLY